jgi:hypothetical protein
VSRYLYHSIPIEKSSWCKDKLNDLGDKGYKIIKSNIKEGTWESLPSGIDGSWYSGDKFFLELEKDTKSDDTYEYIIQDYPANGEWRLSCRLSGKGSGSKKGKFGSDFFGKKKYKDNRPDISFSIFWKAKPGLTTSKTFEEFELWHLNYNEFEGYDDGYVMEMRNFDSQLLLQEVENFYNWTQDKVGGLDLNELRCSDFSGNNYLSITSESGNASDTEIWYGVTLKMNGVEAFVIKSYWKIKKSTALKLFELFLENPLKCADFLLHYKK